MDLIGRIAEVEEVADLLTYLASSKRGGGDEFILAEEPKAHHAVMETRAYGKFALIP